MSKSDESDRTELRDLRREVYNQGHAAVGFVFGIGFAAALPKRHIFLLQVFDLLLTSHHESPFVVQGAVVMSSTWSANTHVRNAGWMTARTNLQLKYLQRRLCSTLGHLFPKALHLPFVLKLRHFKMKVTGRLKIRWEFPKSGSFNAHLLF